MSNETVTAEKRLALAARIANGVAVQIDSMRHGVGAELALARIGRLFDEWSTPEPRAWQCHCGMWNKPEFAGCCKCLKAAPTKVGSLFSCANECGNEVTASGELCMSCDRLFDKSTREIVGSQK